MTVQTRKTRNARATVALFAVATVAALLVLLCLLAAPAPVFAKSPAFPDVDASMPSYDAVGFLSGANVISGYENGSFGPGDTLKRGQATKMLVLWKDIEPVQKATDEDPMFPDLDDVYSGYVETACTAGWITGYTDGRFRPYSTLTRQQMAIIMARAMGWENDAQSLSAGEIEGVLSRFADADDVAAVARPYVAVAVSEGLFGGDAEGRLNPQNGITRAQFCLVVFRAELSVRSVIEQVRSSSEWPDRTRVVLDLSRAPDAVSAYASADGILTIDYTGGVIAGRLSEDIAGSAEVQSVQALQLGYEPRTVRILLDLGRYQTFRVMSLPPADGKGHRLAVDVFRRTDGPEGDGPPLVFLDPGHGGGASGAIGVTGTKEKDLNLALALMLAERLRTAGLRVAMTRDSDREVDLHERARMANEAKANLFVSIHNNAAGNPESCGTETFYWGDKTVWSPDGKLLAEAIQRNLVKAIGSVDRGAKTHWNNLVVLAESEMTAVLAEVGFLSNPEEEAKLLTVAYQQAAAEGIAQGIFEYLRWTTTIYSSES